MGIPVLHPPTPAITVPSPVGLNRRFIEPIHSHRQLLFLREWCVPFILRNCRVSILQDRTHPIALRA
ncbi:hypothetical protein IQ235_05610 [Oscillatoriales cyanobacterium LEGE 11467]|uniref:Uncharacterized protein n=2 Tax=Zarconia TaxID=2992130 RepID=A0A928Z823_9CYAN|nr:hypothetical protein [Zarconia navalis LEGE 11467]